MPRAGAGGSHRGRRRGRRNAAAPGGAAAPRAGSAPAPAIVPEVSHLAESSGGHEPLSADEVAEMKEHLVFLRTYKDVLRVRLNAAEDLLVNGRREPTDRGVCHHLLGKIDRAVIEAAIAREPLRSNVEARARMLAGAVRLSADVGVLLGYLETLPQLRSRTEAAHAFGEVVRRIDFESLSANRLGRLLHVLTETFTGHERVQVLFSLLDGEPFRRAFDAAAGTLPPEIAAVFAPLRAVHRRLLERSATDEDPTLLAAGIEQVLSAPDPVLRTYAEPLRRGILEIALAPGVPAALADRAAGVLLASLSPTTPVYARLATRRAAQLLARHADDRARAVLEELCRAAPGSHTAQQWLEALDARRIGRIALRGGAPDEGRLIPAFWLDGQRSVWTRTAGTPEAERLATEAALQATLALPGVAPVVEHGVASAIPYVAVIAAGRPWSIAAALAQPPAARLVEAAAVARILRALALVGVAVPDADPPRFVTAAGRGGGGVLVLADLDGALDTGPAAAEANASAAVGLLQKLFPEGLSVLPSPPRDDLERALATSPRLAELIPILDHAALAST